MQLRRRTVLTAGLVAGASVLSACTGSGGSSGPGRSATPTDPTEAAVALAAEYLRDWSAADDSGAAARTSDPARAVALLRGTRDNLRIGTLTATPVAPTTNADGSVDVPADVVAQLQGLGTARWQVVLHVVDASRATPYSDPDATASAAATGGTVTADTAAPGSGPLVQFRRTIMHPELTDALRLWVVRDPVRRAAILDRDGRALTVAQTLTSVGVEPDRLTDRAATFRLLASLPNAIPTAQFQQAVAQARPNAFVSALTAPLRAAQYAPVQDRLEATAGVIVRQAETTLTAQEGFARSVLGRMALAGSVPEARRSSLSAGVADTDYVGIGGLQESSDTQLAGTPGGQLVLQQLSGGDPVKVLQSFAGSPGTPLRTTLSLSHQQAAEAALARDPRAGALVAVQASTGQLLAVADQGTAQDREDGVSRALAGRYPPGSTFKVVDSAVLLSGGLAATAPVECTDTITVNGQRFSNVEGEQLGRLPFRTAFANSCNTAFISLRGRIPPAALTATAKQFGIGLDWTLGATSYGGSVPVPANENEEAAALIGQGRVLASPLNMAVTAATVAAGGFHTPVLVTGTGQPPVAAAPAAVAPAVLSGIRGLMAQTVAAGTATGLRGVADGAKTGTAEFGTQPGANGQLPTHSWMIAYRGDVAVCVLVEDGGTGAATAGPVLRRYLQSVT